MEKQKRIAAIHDISCFCKCSLTVALPIISAAGIETAVIPTAILSTHTGGFKGFTSLDLTDEMPKIAAHWKSLDLEFQSIYSGFLGSVEQIAIMEQVLRDFGNDDTLVVIDPVLGDDDALYDTMDEAMVLQMRKLIRYADIITPNETEVKLLLGLPIEQKLYAEQMNAYMPALAQLGPKTVVVTGMQKEDGGHCVCCYQQNGEENGVYIQLDYQELPARYPGTGDIFAAVMTGGLLRGDTLEESISRSADFICQTVADAIAAGEPIRDGVQLEKNLYRLLS